MRELNLQSYLILREEMFNLEKMFIGEANLENILLEAKKKLQNR